MCTVALRDRPSGPVTITVESSNPAEGTVSPATISLDESNFSIPVTVTVVGVDDDLDDSDQMYAVELTATGDGSAMATVPVTNVDNDGVGVTVTPTTGLMTTEAGGTATFTV